MNTKPIIHVHYTDDDYKLWNPPLKPNFEKYLLATPGRIFERCGGFDPLDVLSVSKNKIVLRLDKEIGILRPGETLTMHYELPGLIADGSGFEYFTATIRWLIAEEAEQVTPEPMNDRYLVMKWDYKYDKESTWFDEDSSEEQYQLREGAEYPLPKEDKIKVEIRSVTQEGDTVKAEVYVDHHTVTVVSGQEPVVAHASNSYSVAGDSVHESWCLKFTIQ